MGKAKKFGAVELALTAAAASLITLAIYLAAPAPPPPQPGLTLENFGRISYQMRLNEVEAIFGQRGKPGWYVTGIQEYRWEGADGGFASIDFTTGAVRGHFRDKNVQVRVEQFPVKPTPTEDYLRRWLHL